jgi:hypothetical protein
VNVEVASNTAPESTEIDMSDWIVELDEPEEPDRDDNPAGDTSQHEYTLTLMDGRTNFDQALGSPHYPTTQSLTTHENTEQPTYALEPPEPPQRQTDAQDEVSYVLQCADDRVVAHADDQLGANSEISNSVENSNSLFLDRLSNYIGNADSVINFKRALCDLRTRGSGNATITRGARSSADHLRVVRDLSGQTAANSLLMICHTAKLFESDWNDLINTSGTFLVETQADFGRSRRGGAGNPRNLTKAAITDKILKGLYPDLSPRSRRYQEERRYVTTLRQMATKLGFFCNAFGIGILAFLPYSGAFGNGLNVEKCEI